MTCCEPDVGALATTAPSWDQPVLGQVDVIDLGDGPRIVTRPAPTGPRGLLAALQAAGALPVADVVDDDRLASLHLDPEVNTAHLGFLARI